jgi:hypothetical protein
METKTKDKSKVKTKDKSKVKTKDKSKVKTKDKSNVKPKIKLICIDHEPEINENKYSDKLNLLLNKKKDKSMCNSDVKIRFGWKY